MVVTPQTSAQADQIANPAEGRVFIAESEEIRTWSVKVEVLVGFKAKPPQEHEMRLTPDSGQHPRAIFLRYEPITEDLKFVFQFDELGGMRNMLMYYDVKISIINEDMKHVNDKFAFWTITLDDTNKNYTVRFCNIYDLTGLQLNKTINFEITITKTPKNEPECTKHKSLIDHLKGVMQSFDDADVTFEDGEKVIPGLKMFLCRSSFFRTRIGDTTERKSLKLPKMGEGIFNEFLKYLYTNEVTLKDVNELALLYKASVDYGMLELTIECARLIRLYITRQTMPNILVTAYSNKRAYNLMLTSIIDYITENFDEIDNSAEFQKLRMTHTMMYKEIRRICVAKFNQCVRQTPAE